MKFLIRTVMVSLALLSACIASAQEGPNPVAVNPTSGPPNLMLLVHQEVQANKANDRQKLEVSISRAADRLNAPNFWVEMESMTGPRESLFLVPFDSFEHLEQAGSEWTRFYSAHPEVARMRENLDAMLQSERAIIAVRRDDLGYLVEAIDLSKARFLRIHEVRLFPGHENDFVDAAQSMAEAYANLKINGPFVVYEVHSGQPLPSFLVISPLSSLSESDNPLT